MLIYKAKDPSRAAGGVEMGQAARVFADYAVDPHCLRQLETHFVAPEIYRREDVAARQAKLARVVSDQIIPRLLRIHTEAVPDAPAIALVVEALAPSRQDISGLAEIVLGSDLEAAATYITVLRDRGLSLDTLFVELLEPTARHLGDMWDRDECDFIDVTLGVARLQKLLAIFNDTYAIPALDQRRRVLMAITPGDQHFFGVRMVERFLLAAGWQVQTELSGTAEELAAAAGGQWFAVVGLTMGSTRQVDTLRSAIMQIRRQSLNPAIGIMVGGPMFTANPAMAEDVGADGTAPNAPAAVLVAQRLFDRAAPDFCKTSHE